MEYHHKFVITMATASPKPKHNEGRVKELIEEDEMMRPRSDSTGSTGSTGSRTRAWSGTDFAAPGRPRTFTLERAQRKLVVVAIDDSEPSARAFDCE